MSKLSDEKKMKEVLKEAFDLYLKRNEDYDDAWRMGRPVGLTDNLLWIARRIQIQEKKLYEIRMKEFSF